MSKVFSKSASELAAQTLAQHGYLLRHRCLIEVKNFSETQGALGWYLQGEEYPVSAGDTETVIDFVLACKAIRNIQFVFECKRAHPEFVHWLFADTLVFRRDRYFRAVEVVSQSELAGTAPKLSVTQQTHLLTDLRIMVNGVQVNVDVGLEVNSSKQKNPVKRMSQSNTILEACKQVLTGVAGLASEFQQDGQRLGKTGHRIYVPIVVTTARLYVATYDANKVDLGTGVIEASNMESTEFPWVHFDYAVRPPLPLSPIPEDYYRALPSRTKDDYKVKTVIIVNSTMLTQLLEHLRECLLG